MTLDCHLHEHHLLRAYRLLEVVVGSQKNRLVHKLVSHVLERLKRHLGVLLLYCQIHLESAMQLCDLNLSKYRELTMFVAGVIVEILVFKREYVGMFSYLDAFREQERRFISVEQRLVSAQRRWNSMAITHLVSCNAYRDILNIYE
jgi:hypothetical protein